MQQLSFKKLRRNQKPACNIWIFFTSTFYRIRMQMSTVHTLIKDGSRWKAAYKGRKLIEAIYVTPAQMGRQDCYKRAVSTDCTKGRLLGEQKC